MATMRQRRETKQAKTKNREIRQEDMRQRIKQSTLLTDVFEVKRQLLANEGSDPEGHMTAIDVGRIKAAADISMKLLNKVMPDLKQVEQTMDVTLSIPQAIEFKVVKK